MSENIKVIITAVETVRYERIVELSQERYAKYQEMVERGADDVELTAVFGDLLGESPDVADSLGLEDLKIVPMPLTPEDPRKQHASGGVWRMAPIVKRKG